ncbi:MAG: hypothetical protein JXQ75_03240 [Phycisphaerae bacterium]|nr:hypothetical protein [Phycisphaerae bacterium]
MNRLSHPRATVPSAGARSPCRGYHGRGVSAWLRSAQTCTALAVTLACCWTAGGCGKDAPQKAQAAGGPDPVQAPSVTKRVLLVHSYHTGYPWVDAITQGVKRALPGSSVDLQVFYMDTKLKTSEEWKTQAGQAAQQVVSEWQPDVVIAADDNAQQYFAKHYAGRPMPQFVFCGVNAEPQDYGYPAPNVTGVVERPHFKASIDLLRKVCPGVKRLALVTDNSETSAGALHFMRGRNVGIEIASCETPGTFAKWQAAIERAQTSADAIAIYMYHTIKREGREGEELSMPPKEVMEWTIAHSTLPIVGFFIFTVDDGALCGLVESGVEHGFRAGRIALDVLKGKTAGSIPIVTALEGQSMLNLATAHRLGITIPANVIQGTDIVIGE